MPPTMAPTGLEAAVGVDELEDEGFGAGVMDEPVVEPRGMDAVEGMGLGVVVDCWDDGEVDVLLDPRVCPDGYCVPVLTPLPPVYIGKSISPTCPV